jgi:RNA polymerase sigma-70 factor (ECF subfamily)
VTPALASIVRVSTDGELVEQARSGNTAAFGELVERHRGAVYRAALVVLRDPAEAEDVAQEALVLAYRRLEQYRGEASVRTWMVTIAWRLSVSRRRAPWWRLREMIAPDSASESMMAATQSPEARLLSGEFAASIRRHIRRLPPRLRDALLMAAAGDLSQEEIAAAMQIPAATFRGRVHEARQRLREKILVGERGEG